MGRPGQGPAFGEGLPVDAVPLLGIGEPGEDGADPGPEQRAQLRPVIAPGERADHRPAHRAGRGTADHPGAALRPEFDAAVGLLLGPALAILLAPRLGQRDAGEQDEAGQDQADGNGMRHEGSGMRGTLN